MKRRGILGLIAATVAAVTTPARAQESTPAGDDPGADDRCIGLFTPQGMEFSGKGYQVIESVDIKSGLLIARTSMTEPGYIKLVRGDGKYYVLGGHSEPFSQTITVEIDPAGKHYVASVFPNKPGDWTLTIEQPTE